MPKLRNKREILKFQLQFQDALFVPVVELNLVSVIPPPLWWSDDDDNDDGGSCVSVWSFSSSGGCSASVEAQEWFEMNLICYGDNQTGKQKLWFVFSNACWICIEFNKINFFHSKLTLFFQVLFFFFFLLCDILETAAKNCYSLERSHLIYLEGLSYIFLHQTHVCSLTINLTGSRGCRLECLPHYSI